MSEDKKDKRFAKIKNDPSFKEVKRKEKKTKIDKRFIEVFSEDRKTDKYGKEKKDGAKKRLNDYYEFPEEETIQETNILIEEKVLEKEDKVIPSNTEEIEEDEEGVIETKRLAIANIDWDMIKAKDLFHLLSSFANDNIQSVKIYPTEYGKENGSNEIVLGDLYEDTESERIRLYKLERMKHYYAIVDFDSIETSSTVYKECDGMELETSSNIINLQYVPDSMIFDNEHDACTKKSNRYVPRSFDTSALMKTTPSVDWDDEDLERKKILEGGFEGNISDEEAHQYIGSVSESEEETERKTEEYKKILLELEDE
eukprot:GHVP01027799.1.p1 GENE.GHVP01027799.1~~GHVP01027799.1.p1  ORF type:complete len:313 (-),score=95.47 GHVP01027799.1:772-1710(-)